MGRRRALLIATLLLLPLSLYAIEEGQIYVFFSDAADNRARSGGQTIFPTLLIPSGGEYEGMGTAYTAVARDASFFDSNPAASATLEYTELALTHNNWIADSYVDGVTYTIRGEHLGVAVGGKAFHVPFTEIGPTSQTPIDPVTGKAASGQYMEATFGFNVAYNFLESYDFHGVSVGASVKAAYRRIPEFIVPGQSAFAALADIGILTRFNLLKLYATRAKNFSLGLSARNLGLPVRGEALPSSVNAGAAYQPIRPLLFAVDLVIPLNFVAGVSPDPIGFSTGVSVAVTPFFSVQSGVLLQPGLPRFTLGADTDLEGVSISVNWSRDLASELTVFNRISVQARLNFGDRGRAELRQRIDQLYFDAWDAWVAGELEQAISFAEESLELDPDFRLAIELLERAQQTLELQRQLERIEAGDIENF